MRQQQPYNHFKGSLQVILRPTEPCLWQLSPTLFFKLCEDLHYVTAAYLLPPEWLASNDLLHPFTYPHC